MHTPTTTNSPSPCPFHTLPTEILLDIISSVPFTPPNLLTLRLTCTRFHTLLTHHERSIAADFRRRTFGPETLSRFPGLDGKSYASLRQIHGREAVLESVHAEWLKIVNHGPELSWLKGRWEGVHRAGLLLLYRLQDAGRGLDCCGSYAAKVELLDSLPAQSLACLLFKLIASVRILRVLGPEPIKESWARQDAGVRSEVELACEELLLTYGPEFFIALMDSSTSSQQAKAVATLQEEHAAMPTRQTFPVTDAPKPATLIATLRRALAARTGCGVNAVVTKMWEVLSCTGFDGLGDEGSGVLGRVVRGEEFARGELGGRRIF